MSISSIVDIVFVALIVLLAVIGLYTLPVVRQNSTDTNAAE